MHASTSAETQQAQNADLSIQRLRFCGCGTTLRALRIRKSAPKTLHRAQICLTETHEMCRIAPRGPRKALQQKERWLSWSKALDSKSSVAEMSPWVRIPLSPLNNKNPLSVSEGFFCCCKKKKGGIRTHGEWARKPGGLTGTPAGQTPLPGDPAPRAGPEAWVESHSLRSTTKIP